MIASLLTALSLPVLFGSVTVQSYICQPPAKPAIIAPVSGTTVTAGAVEFTGSATASTQVTLSVDGSPAVQTTADQLNSFEAQATLAAGSHTIGILSTSPCGSQAGDDITLVAIPPPVISGGTSSNGSGGASTLLPTQTGSTPSNGQTPANQTTTAGSLTLTIKTPWDGTSTKAASVYVQGTVSRSAIVVISVNGKEVGRTLTPSTTFGLSIPLEIGQNTVTVTAITDTDQASVKLHITRLAINPGEGNHPLPWWRTLPGQIIIIIAVIILLGLLLWLMR